MFKASDITRNLFTNISTIRTYVSRNGLRLTNANWPVRSGDKLGLGDEHSPDAKRGYSLADAVRIYIALHAPRMPGEGVSDIVRYLNAVYDQIDRVVEDWSIDLDQSGKTNRAAGPWIMLGAKTQNGPDCIFIPDGKHLLDAIAGPEANARHQVNRITFERLIDLKEATRNVAVLMRLVRQSD